MKLSTYLSKKAQALAERAHAVGMMLSLDKNDVWRLLYGDAEQRCKNLRDVRQRIEMVEWAKRDAPRG